MKKNMVWTIIGGCLFSVSSLLRSLIIAKQLNVETFGLWNVYQVLMIFFAMADFGTLCIMANEYVVGRMGGDESRVKALRETGFVGSVLFALATMGVFSVYVALTGKAECLRHWPLLVTILFSQQLFSFFINLSRAEYAFGIAAITNSVVGLCSLAGVYYCVGSYALQGVLLSIVSAQLLACGACFLLLRRPSLIGWSWGICRELLQKGIPVVLVGACGLLMQNIDRIFVGKYLGILNLGYYGINSIAVFLIFWLPGTLGGFLLSYFARDASSKAPNVARVNLVSLFLVISLLVSLLCSAILVFADGVIGRWLPKYAAGLGILNLVVLAAYLYSCTLPLANFLIANQRQGVLFLTQGIFLIFQVGLLYLFNFLGWGMRGVPIANALAFLSYYLVTVALIEEQNEWGIAFAAEMLIILLIEFAYSGASIWICRRIGPEWSGGGGFGAAFLVKSGAYLALSMPFAASGYFWLKRKRRDLPIVGGEVYRTTCVGEPC